MQFDLVMLRVMFIHVSAFFFFYDLYLFFFIFLFSIKWTKNLTFFLTLCIVNNVTVNKLCGLKLWTLHLWATDFQDFCIFVWSCSCICISLLWSFCFFCFFFMVFLALNLCCDLSEILFTDDWQRFSNTVEEKAKWVFEKLKGNTALLRF